IGAFRRAPVGKMIVLAEIDREHLFGEHEKGMVPNQKIAIAVLAIVMETMGFSATGWKIVVQTVVELRPGCRERRGGELSQCFSVECCCIRIGQRRTYYARHAIPAGPSVVCVPAASAGCNNQDSGDSQSGKS